MDPRASQVRNLESWTAVLVRLGIQHHGQKRQSGQESGIMDTSASQVSPWLQNHEYRQLGQARAPALQTIAPVRLVQGSSIMDNSASQVGNLASLTPAPVRSVQDTSASQVTPGLQHHGYQRQPCQSKTPSFFYIQGVTKSISTLFFLEGLKFQIKIICFSILLLKKIFGKVGTHEFLPGLCLPLTNLLPYQDGDELEDCHLCGKKVAHLDKHILANHGEKVSNSGQPYIMYLLDLPKHHNILSYPQYLLTLLLSSIY